MKYSTSSLIEQHNALLAQPYGKRRNAKLWKIQAALEARGLFNNSGTLRQCVTAETVQGFQRLAVGGGK